MTNILIPKLTCLVSTGRPDRSTELEVGRPCRSTDVHRTCTPGLLEGRSTDPVDRRELLLSGKPWSTGTVNRQRSLFSVPGHGRPGRSIEAPTVRFLTVGASVDRPGRPWPGTESRSLCRSTDLVDRGFPESRSSLRSTGPPARLACTSVHVGRPTRSTDFKLGRPARSTG